MRTPARGTSCAAVVESIALSSSAAAGLAGRHTLLLTKCATNSITVFIEKSMPMSRFSLSRSAEGYRDALTPRSKSRRME